MTPNPFISIIICTYNRMEYLPNCLEHLKNQTAKKEFYEIIIIDNNSSDKTELICKDYIQKNSEINVTYFLEKKPGLSNARNRGIKEAKGDILCFIDDDGFATANYVKTISKYASNINYSNYIAFGGKVIPCYNKGKEPIWISKYISGLVSEVDLGTKVKSFNKKYPAGCNMVFRKEFFENHGGFNVDLHTRGDDKYIFQKLRDNNYKILYVPELKVSHFIDDYRLEKNFIIRLSKIIGQSEAIRLKNKNIIIKMMKLFEYLIKWKMSLLLAFIFLSKGQIEKSKYIVMVRWQVILGYFIKKQL